MNAGLIKPRNNSVIGFVYAILAATFTSTVLIIAYGFINPTLISGGEIEVSTWLLFFAVQTVMMLAGGYAVTGILPAILLMTIFKKIGVPRGWSEVIIGVLVPLFTVVIPSLFYDISYLNNQFQLLILGLLIVSGAVGGLAYWAVAGRQFGDIE